jgi:hypothetical protein
MSFQGAPESGGEDRGMTQSGQDAPISALSDHDAALQHRGLQRPKLIDLRVHIQGAFGWCYSWSEGAKDEEGGPEWHQMNLGREHKQNHVDQSHASSPKIENSRYGKKSPHKTEAMMGGTGDLAAPASRTSNRKLENSGSVNQYMARDTDDSAALDPQKEHDWSEEEGVAERLWDDILSGGDLHGVQFAPVRLVEVRLHGPQSSNEKLHALFGYVQRI